MGLLPRTWRKLQYEIKQQHKRFVWRTARYHIVSFPKSGRTWVRVFLAAYFSRAYNVDVSDRFAQVHLFRTRLPRVVFAHRGFIGDVVRKARKGWISVPHIKEESIPWYAGKRVALLVRDPRDVVVSHYFSAKKRSANPTLEAEMEGMDLATFIRHSNFGIANIVAYMNAWHAARSSYRDFCIIRYEDLRVDPKEYFSQLLTFLGEEVQSNALNAALEFSDFKNMQKRERTKPSVDPRLKPGDKADPESYKTRRGKVGGYADYFNEHDLLYVDDVMKDLNPAFGYDLVSTKRT